MLDGPLAEAAVAAPTAAEFIEGVKVLSSFQVSQPRDPFRPLITEDSSTGDTGNGTDNGFDPTGIRVTLVEIRDVSGVLRATVKVDGTDYDVGVGDTFATNFKVVSLDPTSGVFPLR